MPALDRIDPKALGERLRIARTNASVTQEIAADALGAARTTMVAIEAGERRVRPEELLILVDLYRVSANEILRSTAVTADLGTQFRRNWSASEAKHFELIQTLHRLGSSAVDLEMRLGREVARDYVATRRIGRGQLAQQAEDLAMELRSQLGLGLAPVQDVLALAEDELHMRIFLWPLPADVSGAFAFAVGLGPCVLVNSKHPRTRQSWTLAHEIGHFLTTRDEAEVSIESEAKPASEKFADFFAAAFLMPAATVRRRFAESEAGGKFSSRDLIGLAGKFHVSLEAMGMRLEQLSLLPHGTHARLRRKGLNEAHIEEVLGFKPSQQRYRSLKLSILAVDALEKALISEGQAAEMLQLDRTEVRDLAAALRDVAEGD